MGRRAGFLPQNPDFSGFASRFSWKHLLPGLADSHVRETVSFPDLLSPQSGGRRRCFKSIRAGRNIRDLNGSVPVHPSVQNYWGFFLPGDQRLSGSVHLPRVAREVPHGLRAGRERFPRRQGPMRALVYRITGRVFEVHALRFDILWLKRRAQR